VLSSVFRTSSAGDAVCFPVRSGGPDQRGHRRPEKLLQRIGAHRAGEQETLRKPAAELLEALGLRGPFDPLGDAAEVELAG
jgi:hypothetical protein